MIESDLVNDQIRVIFGGENFQEILNVCRKHHFKWDPDDKCWYTDKRTFYNSKDELLAIESFYIAEPLLEAIKPVLEVRYVRRPFHKELLKYPPIVGKGENVDYQITDIKKTLSSNRKVINWDTGLGKTYLGSVVLSHLFKSSEIGSVLIVAPNHLKINWKRELKKFFYLDLNDDDFYVTSIFNRSPFESNKKFIISSYRNLVMISDDYYKKTKKKKSKSYRKTYLPIDLWFKGVSRCVILDESHSIKNKSRQTEVALQIKKYFDFRYLLSATITPNSIVDLFYQFEFLDENIINSNYYSFLERIAYLGNNFSQYAIKVDRETGEKLFKKEEILKLKEQLAPYIISRKKEDCLDLPDNIIKNIYCTLEGVNLKIYQQTISYCLNIVKEEKGFIESREVRNKLPYILQAINNVGMLQGKIDPLKNQILHDMIAFWKFEEHPKLEPLSEMLKEYLEDNRKVIIFSYHPKTIDDLAFYYKKYSPFVIHGQIKISENSKDLEEEKDLIINTFKTSEKKLLLIANPSVIKTGLNIIECSRIVYFDRDYNFETYYQSRDRIYRYGQTKDTRIVNLIAENTFDEVIDKRLESKEDLNALFTKTETKTLQEWKNLFEGKI